MTTAAIVEAFFAHLSTRDWDRLGGVLSQDVERVGPFGDKVAGRNQYLGFLKRLVPADYGNDVLRIVMASDGRSAFARVNEHLVYGDRDLHLDEVYSFEIGEDGRIRRVEIYWQTPGWGQDAASGASAAS